MIKKICQLLLIALIITGFSIPGLSKAELSPEHVAFYNTGQANNVISDDDFINYNSMTVEGVQSFLDAKNSFLKSYIDNSEFGMGRSAAQIIWDAAHGKYQAGGSFNGININESTGTINPKLILVYLQKEQSLISRTEWNDWAMLASMGYFCYTNFGRDNPGKDNDGNNCHDSYQGFTRQVENGAWQLRYNYERSQGTGFSDYQTGQTRNTEDGFLVYLHNRATASVYRYTPYVYYSAYNVWNLFHNVYQFGTSPQSVSPSPAPVKKPGDANGDNSVDSTDLSILADQWGKGVIANTGADFNGDGVVDSTDLSILADRWGK